MKVVLRKWTMTPKKLSLKRKSSQIEETYNEMLKDSADEEKWFCFCEIYVNL